MRFDSSILPSSSVVACFEDPSGSVIFNFSSAIGSSVTSSTSCSISRCFSSSGAESCASFFSSGRTRPGTIRSGTRASRNCPREINAAASRHRLILGGRLEPPRDGMHVEQLRNVRRLK